VPRALIYFLILAALCVPLNLRSEGYVGYVPQKPEPPPAQKDKRYEDKLKEVDQWTKQAYQKLNDGRQEAYVDELTRRYYEQIRDINRGGLGYAPEMPKFISHKVRVEE